MKINTDETMITNMDIEKTGSTFFKIAITMLDGRTLIAENVNLNVLEQMRDHLNNIIDSKTPLE